MTSPSPRRDVEALRLTQDLVDPRRDRAGTEQASSVRSAAPSPDSPSGRRGLHRLDGPADADEDDATAAARAAPEGVPPVVQRVAALRRAAARSAMTGRTTPTGLDVRGFVDIVGYTTRSRRMTRTELTDMVERFEEVTTGLITDHHGRVVKTIGDEVLFELDDAKEGARLALELLEQHLDDERSPRSGSGWPTATSCTTWATSSVPW